MGLTVNHEGKPQARNLSAYQGGTTLGNASFTGQSFYGEIKCMASKFGFIECKPVMTQYGNDVFFPSSAAPPGCGVGDKIEFDLMVNQSGQPQAANLQAKGSASKGCGNRK